jgi:hypothetical protein
MFYKIIWRFVSDLESLRGNARGNGVQISQGS